MSYNQNYGIFKEFKHRTIDQCWFSRALIVNIQMKKCFFSYLSGIQLLFQKQIPTLQYISKQMSVQVAKINQNNTQPNIQECNYDQPDTPSIHKNLRFSELKDRDVTEVFQSFLGNNRSVYEKKLTISSISGVKSNRFLQQFKNKLNEDFGGGQKVSKIQYPTNTGLYQKKYTFLAKNLKQTVIFITIKDTDDGTTNILFRGPSGEPIGYMEEIPVSQKFSEIAKKVKKMSTPLIMLILDETVQTHFNFQKNMFFFEDLTKINISIFYAFRMKSFKKKTDLSYVGREFPNQLKDIQMRWDVFEEESSFCVFSKFFYLAKSQEYALSCLDKLVDWNKEDQKYICEIAKKPEPRLSCVFCVLVIKYIYKLPPAQALEKAHFLFSIVQQEKAWKVTSMKQMIQKNRVKIKEIHRIQKSKIKPQKCMKCFSENTRKVAMTRKICTGCSLHFGFFIYVCDGCFMDFHLFYPFYERRIISYYNNKSLPKTYNLNKNYSVHQFSLVTKRHFMNKQVKYQNGQSKKTPEPIDIFLTVAGNYIQSCQKSLNMDERKKSKSKNNLSQPSSLEQMIKRLLDSKVKVVQDYCWEDNDIELIFQDQPSILQSHLVSSMWPDQDENTNFGPELDEEALEEIEQEIDTYDQILKSKHIILQTHKSSKFRV